MVKTPPTSSTTSAPHCHHLTNQRQHDLQGQNTFPDFFLFQKTNTVFKWKVNYCWWFWNPANQLINSLIPFTKSTSHKHYVSSSFSSPIIYRVLYIPGGAGFLPSTVSYPKCLCTKKVVNQKRLYWTQEVQISNSLIISKISHLLWSWTLRVL